jgi:uridine kinase
MHIDHLRDSIIECRKQTHRDRASLVGISGIDASGKGYVSGRLASRLKNAGQRVALINVDGWLNLPHVRFSKLNAGEHFYRNALRLGEMFDRLILPIKHNRRVDLTMQFAEEMATAFRSHNYALEDIDVILLEGIFIFKRELVPHFDLKIWIECSFETALRRAVVRGQEDLSPADTIAAYETIYFPAQRHHLKVDNPVAAADAIYANE